MTASGLVRICCRYGQKKVGISYGTAVLVVAAAFLLSLDKRDPSEWLWGRPLVPLGLCHTLDPLPEERIDEAVFLGIVEYKAVSHKPIDRPFRGRGVEYGCR